MLKGLIFEYENKFDPARNYFNEFRECMPASNVIGLPDYANVAMRYLIE